MSTLMSHFAVYSAQIIRIRFPNLRQRLLGEVVLRVVTEPMWPVLPPVQATKTAAVAALPRSVSTTWLSGLATWKRRVGLFLSGILIVIALVTTSFWAIPAVYYHFFPAESVAIVPTESSTPLGGDFTAGAQSEQVLASYLPPQDETLPEGQWIVIPRIGVRTELQADAQPEEALATGVWMVPGYGSPGDKTQPMIVAAHRFGWKWWWESDYWKYHSFYLLPDLEPGDTVEIIADQRKWVYEIYAGEEGEEITDYQADLIMYTCKFLNSPLRHFRYARLLDPTQDSQSLN